MIKPGYYLAINHEFDSSWAMFAIHVVNSSRVVASDSFIASWTRPMGDFEIEGTVVGYSTIGKSEFKPITKNQFECLWNMWAKEKRK